MTRSAISMLACSLLLSSLAGCLSMSSTRLGMDEKEWLRSTFIADLAYLDGDVKAYRSGGAYYYFLNGKLIRIDQGMLPAQTIRLELR